MRTTLSRPDRDQPDAPTTGERKQQPAAVVPSATPQIQAKQFPGAPASLGLRPAEPQLGANTAAQASRAARQRAADPTAQLKPEASGAAPAVAVADGVELDGGAALPAPLAGAFSAGLGHDVRDVRVHPESAAAASLGARALTVGRDVAFAPGQYKPETRTGQQLIAHELAHVVQQSHGETGAQAAGLSDDAFEQEADRAADTLLGGGSVGPLAPFGGGRPQLAPPPGTAESPIAASISKEFANPDSPGKLDVTVSLAVPGFGDRPAEKQKIIFHKPVLGATTVTTYQVRLEDLYASADDAAAARKLPEKKREKLSLRASLNPDNLPSAKAASTPPKSGAPAPKDGTTPPAPAPAPAVKKDTAASVEKPAATTTPGKVESAGPSPTDTPEVVFDLAGKPVGLVARSADFGITTEFTKLAVGAASCTVLQTKSGISLIDAGVHSVGKTPDAKMIDYAMKRLREIVGDRPIEELLISHSHLDHVALFKRISSEFVIKQITINTAQLSYPSFLKQALNLADRQRALIEEQLQKKFKGQRVEWGKKNKLPKEADEAAVDKAFDKWVGEQVAAELAKVKPIEVKVLAPGGSAVDTAATASMGDIKVTRQEPPAHGAEEGEGFSFTDTARSILADPDYRKKYDKLATETDPKKTKSLIDEMSSTYVMQLPNGNQLVLLPDIRADDIARVQTTLKAELARLGANVEFRVWDMTHHMQSGFVGKTDTGAPAAPPGSPAAGATPAAAPVDVGGARMSELAKLSDMLTRLTSTPGKGGAKVVDAVVVSAHPDMVDPAMVWILRSCGLQVFTAQNEKDVQFIEAATASGRKFAGTPSKEYPGLQPSDPLLRRTALALEELRDEMQRTNDQLTDETATKNVEADAKVAANKVARQALKDARKSLSAKATSTETAVKSTTPRALKTPLADRESAMRTAADALKANDDAVAAMDKEVADLRAQGKRLQPDVDRLEKQIDDIETARKAYLKKIDDTIGKSRLEPTKPKVAPAEGSDSPFKAEEEALGKLVDPVYRHAIEVNKLPQLGETTLVILGKGAQTDAGKKLEADRIEIEKLRSRIEAGDRPIEAHGELIGKLSAHLDELRARPDAADPAVKDEIDLYEQQLTASQGVVKDAADKGTKSIDRDATTGAIVESSVIVEKTAEEADKESGGADPAKPAGEPGAEGAKPGLTERGLKLFGQVMGGVMIYQNISGAENLLERYGANKAGGAEMSVGMAKSAYGMNIGYRMLKGSHVGMGEFVVLSVLDITQTALQSYDNSADFNTEVTYAIIRNAVSLALSAVGMALIETANPIGIVAGLAVMFLGDTILDALGIHAWLAKKFDWRPDEYIDLENDLRELIKDYSVVVGALELQERDDASLQKVGATVPGAVRGMARGIVASNRPDLTKKERKILDEFSAAYERAQKGYSQLKEIDELSAQFKEYYSKAHAGDVKSLGPSTWGTNLDDRGNMVQRDMGMVTFDEVKQRFAAMNEVLRPNAPGDSFTESQVEGMEQWSKMDEWISTLEEYLYRTPDDWIDWMKVSEAESHLSLMISNARYRLNPSAQGTLRGGAMFPEHSGPRTTYEKLLTEREHKLDVLHQRSIDLASGKSTTLEMEFDEYGEASYPEPDYAAPTATLDDQIAAAAAAVESYKTQIAGMPPLPGAMTPEALYSDPTELGRYHDAAMGDSGYKAALFKLKATEVSVTGLVTRVSELGESADQKTQDKASKVIEDLRQAKMERKVKRAYLFLEDVPAVSGRIDTAQSKLIAVALNQDPTTVPLTDEEKAAAPILALAGMGLGTQADRARAAGVVMPTGDDDLVFGLYTIDGAPKVLVTMGPDPYEHYDEGGGEIPVNVVPFNAAAIAYFGSGDPQMIGEWKLNTLTLAQLRAITGADKAATPPAADKK